MLTGLWAAGEPAAQPERLNSDMKKYLPLLTLMFVIAACGGASEPAATTPAPSATTPAPSLGADSLEPTLVPRPSGTDTKMSSQLYMARLLADDGFGFDDIAAAVPELQFDENGVLIEVTLDAVDAETVAALTNAGLVISNEFPDLLLVNGSIAPADLSGLAELESVVSIAAAFGFTNN